MKTCNRCQTSKQESEFSACKARKDGLQDYCKSCVNQRAAEYRAKNRALLSAKQKAYAMSNVESIRAKKAEYRAKNKTAIKAHRIATKAQIKITAAKYYAANKERINASSKAWMKRNLAYFREYAKRTDVAYKVKARRKVRTEIDSGRVIRMPCELCGIADSHAHHDNYEKPLSVQWLCRKHHAEIHFGTGVQS